MDDLKAAMSGMLAPEQKEEVIGSAEIRTVFVASKIGTVAGSYVTGLRRKRARAKRRAGRKQLEKKQRAGGWRWAWRDGRKAANEKQKGGR